jgi:putative ABC transport system substrate-binding protein
MRPESLQRREFIVLLSAAAAAPVLAPVAARAQRATVPVLGYLSARSLADTAHLVAAVRRGLAEHGFVEGRNVRIEYRFADGQYDRLPAMAADLVGRGVTVLTTTGGEPAAFAAKAATTAIPIVFLIGGDPVKQGLVASFNRPDGNVTGVTLLTNLLEPKRLGLLRELVPSAARIGFLFNPSFSPSAGQLADVQQAARAISLQVDVLRANSDAEIDAAFETIVQQRLGALAVAASPFFDTRREKLVGLAARHLVPAMYHFREFAVAGGLVSYGIDPVEAYRQTGLYTGRVLKGTRPADLPVMQATKFEFVINLKTAKALGLEVPPAVSARADEVIE